MSPEKIQKALRIKRVVKEYFATSNEEIVPAKDLMKQFIIADIFSKDHKDGLPIRDFLRELDKEGYLNLIPQIHFEQKDQNKNWFFINKK